MRCVFTAGAARRVFCGAYPAFADAAAYLEFAVFIEFADAYPAFADAYPTFADVYPAFADVYPVFADAYPALAVEYAARCVFAPFALWRFWFALLGAEPRA